MISIECRKQLAGATGHLQLNVQMQIEQGAFVTLFGASGAGKTSLLRMLAGLTQPDSGRIEVGGEVWFDSEKRLSLSPQQRLVGVVFQDYALFPNLTVAENVAYALHKSQLSQAPRLMALTGLSQLSDRLPANLSGGQKQRVALARALARVLPVPGATMAAKKSSLLLLDEPLSALDAALRGQLQDELLMLHREFGLTTLLVSHDIGEVFKLSQQVFVLEHGKILHSGSPAEVFLQQPSQGKLNLQAQVLAIRKEDVVFILSLVVGQDIVEIIASHDEVAHLQVGQRIAISAKAFSPMLFT
ncbi:ABC transporter ATP-binding protein [Undibacterium sp. SXout20W]|uniref:ABC transporter ATP-binding protein n=1 Tax=Undibacterium sp. SXout20W TaxID=3413051 RepID=UPI003BF15321